MFEEALSIFLLTCSVATGIVAATLIALVVMAHHFLTEYAPDIVRSKVQQVPTYQVVDKAALDKAVVEAIADVVRRL